MSDEKNEQNDQAASGKPEALEVKAAELSSEELDLAELEEERRRLWSGILVGFGGSGVLIAIAYVLNLLLAG